eukprot:gene39307-53130_t
MARLCQSASGLRPMFAIYGPRLSGSLRIPDEYAAQGGIARMHFRRHGPRHAARYIQGRMATVAVNEFIFKQPVRVGDILSFFSAITRVGNTSVTVEVEVYAERFSAQGQYVKVTEARLTYVAIDHQGRPRPVPKHDAPAARQRLSARAGRGFFHTLSGHHRGHEWALAGVMMPSTLTRESGRLSEASAWRRDSFMFGLLEGLAELQAVTVVRVTVTAPRGFECWSAPVAKSSPKLQGKVKIAACKNTGSLNDSGHRSWMLRQRLDSHDRLDPPGVGRIHLDLDAQRWDGTEPVSQTPSPEVAHRHRDAVDQHDPTHRT